MYISNFKTYLPNDFIPEIYKKINSDLINLNNDKDIINHYLQEGYFENRIYKINLPDDFIPEIYKKLNNDLENLVSNKYELVKFIDELKIDINNRYGYQIRSFENTIGI